MGLRIDTAVIGGGQAGLATSYYLGRRQREHVVLEQATQAGNASRNGRWDSFTLVTPNWSFRLPGAEYQGDAPDAFMPRDEVIARFEQYVDRFKLPVRHSARVTSVEQDAGSRGSARDACHRVWRDLRRANERRDGPARPARPLGCADSEV